MPYLATDLHYHEHEWRTHYTGNHLRPLVIGDLVLRGDWLVQCAIYLGIPLIQVELAHDHVGATDITPPT